MSASMSHWLSTAARGGIDVEAVPALRAEAAASLAVRVALKLDAGGIEFAGFRAVGKDGLEPELFDLGHRFGSAEDGSGPRSGGGPRSDLRGRGDGLR